MRARVLLLAILCAGCGPLTEVVVTIDGEPGFASRVELTVTNPDLTSLAKYQSGPLDLCPGATGCRSYPITATLVPGKQAPGERVRVRVDAYDAAGTLLQSDAATFTFVSGQSLALRFFLREGCRNTQCALEEKACLQTSGCTPIVPIPPNPDQAPPDDFGPVGQDGAGPGLDGGSPPGQLRGVAFFRTANDTMIQATPPPGVALGDLVLVGVSHKSPAPMPSVPGGWDLVGMHALGPGNQGFVLSRPAKASEASDPPAYKFTTTGPPGDWEVVVLAYHTLKSVSNVDVVTPTCDTCTVSDQPAAATTRVVSFILPGLGSTCTAMGLPMNEVHSDPVSSSWLVLDPLSGSGPWAMSCTPIAQTMIHRVLVAE